MGFTQLAGQRIIQWEKRVRGALSSAHTWVCPQHPIPSRDAPWTPPGTRPAGRLRSLPRAAQGWVGGAWARVWVVAFLLTNCVNLPCLSFPQSKDNRVFFMKWIHLECWEQRGARGEHCVSQINAPVTPQSFKPTAREVATREHRGQSLRGTTAHNSHSHILFSLKRLSFSFERQFGFLL